MKLIDIIKLKLPNFSPEEYKLHLAVWNGKEDPLDVFLAGNFQQWQEYQTKKNFERKYIVSLISLPSPDSWLFAGIYESNSCQFNENIGEYHYNTKPITEVEELVGRLVINYKRASRQSYLYFEKLIDNCSVSEYKPKRITVSDFLGYNKTRISKPILDIIISEEIESWKTALSNVAGVYIITDLKTGKMYVGSATGDEGIWQRWREYSSNGHGGNKELISLLKENGKEYCNNFQYTILEIADTHASNDDIEKRESYWKDVLSSRVHGYNSN